MLLPETKEREYRFKLALKMGIPIFGLIIIFLSNAGSNFYKNIEPSFYFLAILLLVFCIYFILFLIYKGFKVRITENITNTFTREYLYQYIKKEIIKNKEYTLILLSVENINDVNNKYGINKGDKVLFQVAQHIGIYLKGRGIKNFPMGHIKGGDFILGLEGDKYKHKSMLDLLCLKSSEFMVDDIEVRISGAIIDTNFSNDLNHLVQRLFDLQGENKKPFDETNPNELEQTVLKAIKMRHLKINTQNIYENNNLVIQEYFIRLCKSNTQTMHPKTYIKTINKLGLRAKYDLLILEESIKKFKINNIAFAVQIDPSSLRNYTFLKDIISLIDKNPQVRENIIIIFNEKEYYSNNKKFNATLQSLREKGIKIGLDKLGTSHTSFLYLRDLDIDMVRFDSFYSKNDANKETAQGLQLIANSKNVKTWFKMIEHDDVQSYAENININYLQGNLLSKIVNEE